MKRLGWEVRKGFVYESRIIICSTYVGSAYGAGRVPAGVKK